MLVIALLAMIGAMLDAWTAYWIVYGFYCFFWAIGQCIKLAEKGKK